jgi:SAM-dependent methyltransferase
MRSAEVVVPLVLRFVPATSVVDVGCGDGTWLAVFRQHGVDEILGLDGDYVGAELLQISRDRFQECDLTKPFEIGRSFDLAVSLEVAEHLPAESASVFVECLTRLVHAVLFSAAIPYQVGVNHLNEQWPDKWAELFQHHGYVPVDMIRRNVWRNEAVEPWYAQNTLLFARKDVLESNAALKAEFERTDPNQLSLVHPRQYLFLQRHMLAQIPKEPPKWGVRGASMLLLRCFKDALARRVRLIASKRTRSETELSE